MSGLMVTDGRPENRRLTYDVELAAGEVIASGHPDAEGIARTYRLARRPD